MQLGATINTVRKQRGFNQGELADMIGMTQSYMSLIEKDKKEPNLTTLKKISEALNLPLPILFFLSLDNDDIPERKQEAFNLIGPSLRSMIGEFFIINNTND